MSAKIAAMPAQASSRWLNQKLIVRGSPIAGLGLFAIARVERGEECCRLAGELMTDKRFRVYVAGRVRYSALAVDERLHLVQSDDDPTTKGNHSCDPNMWLEGGLTGVARRAIAAGDEATIDYALLTAEPTWSMECKCGSALCRDVVTGEDWRLPQLRARYEGTGHRSLHGASEPRGRAHNCREGGIVSWPGTCQHGAVNRHRGAPGGNVFDRAAGTYGTVGPDFFGYFGRRLVDRMGIPRGGRVVDLACGTGAALVPAAEAVGARGLSVGLDLSVAMLRRAGATDAGSRPHLSLACMDAKHLAIRSESFHAVVCSFALGSFPDPRSALAECWRVAKPGGRLGLVVSDRWWWEGDERWSWHGDLLQSIGVPVPVTRFASAEAIDSVLKQAGWELRDLVTESFPMVFSGADEWWAWAWSHGYRQILEGMGAAELTLYRAECFRQLQQHGQPVLGRLEASLVCATRP